MLEDKGEKKLAIEPVATMALFWLTVKTENTSSLGGASWFGSFSRSAAFVSVADEEDGLPFILNT